MELGHILDNSQSREELDEIFEETAKIKALYQADQGKEYLREVLRHKEIVLLFYQPSTRTKIKFSRAATRLGAEVISFDEIAYTSAVKGENWLNTIKTHARTGVDIIVIRHPQNFAPFQAASCCDQYGFKTKIINAGDGNHLHPTQPYGDLYTIREHYKEKFGKEALEIAIGADLKNARVLHSLVMGLARYPVKITLVSWLFWAMPKDYLIPLIENQREFKEVEKLKEKEKFDIIYWIRGQIEHTAKENQDGFRKDYNLDFGITPKFIDDHLKKEGIFLHPGPRGGEVDDSIDADPRVKDGDQVENGIFTSMAILKIMLNPDFYLSKPYFYF